MYVLDKELDGRTLWASRHPHVQVLVLASFKKDAVIAVFKLSNFIDLLEICCQVREEIGWMGGGRKKGALGTGGETAQNRGHECNASDNNEDSEK